MSRLPIGRLLRPQEPWSLTYAAAPEDAYELAWRLGREGNAARVVRGRKMTTIDGFFGEMGAALQLPAYFGENWAALDECLRDLSWLPGDGYVLVVTDAEMLFRDDASDSLGTLLKVAAAAGEAWAAPADRDQPWGHDSVPFHTVFQVRITALRAWNRRVAAIGHTLPELDFDPPRASPAVRGPRRDLV